MITSELPKKAVYKSINKTHFSAQIVRVSSTSKKNSSRATRASTYREKREVVMSDFKVVSTRYQFVTKAAIDFVDLTDEVQEIVANSGIRNGLVHIFAPHATGILILTENNPALLVDIKNFLKETVPKHKEYQHPPNAHAHLRSMLLPPDKTASS